ncbi:MAG: hypothetical protein ACI81R_000176 [Bradymonadia bacterium]
MALTLLGGVVGLWLAPPEIGPIQNGPVTHYGGWPLETAFTLCLLSASWITFRALEVLFRTNDAHAILTLPVRGDAYWLDRLTVLVTEVGLAMIAVSAFLAAGFTRDGDATLTIAAIGYVVVAHLAAAALSFGLVTWACASTVDEGAMARSLDMTRERAGSIYQMVPGISFGACAASLLILKLAFEEPLRAMAGAGSLALTNATFVAAAVALIPAIVSAVAGLRGYGGAHDALQARFLEVESMTVGRMQTWHSEWAASNADDSDELWGRVAAAQLVRRHGMLLPGSWLVGVVALFVTWATGGSISVATWAALAVFWLSIVVHPVLRVQRLAGYCAHGFADTLGDTETIKRAGSRAASKIVWSHVPALCLPVIAGGPSLSDVGYLLIIVSCAAAYHIVGAVKAQPRLAALAGLSAAAIAAAAFTVFAPVSL